MAVSAVAAAKRLVSDARVLAKASLIGSNWRLELLAKTNGNSDGWRRNTLKIPEHAPVKTAQGTCNLSNISSRFYFAHSDFARAFHENKRNGATRENLMASPNLARLSKEDANAGFREAKKILSSAKLDVSIERFVGCDPLDGGRVFFSLVFTPPMHTMPRGGFPLAMVFPGLMTNDWMYSHIARLLAANGYKVMIVDRPPDMPRDIMIRMLPLAVYAGIHAASMRDVDIENRRNLSIGLSAGGAVGLSMQAISRVQKSLELGNIRLPLLPNGAFFSFPYYMVGMFNYLIELESNGEMPFILKKVLQDLREMGVTKDMVTGLWENSARLFSPALSNKLPGEWDETRAILLGGAEDRTVPPANLRQAWADLHMLPGVADEPLVLVPGPGIHPDPKTLFSPEFFFGFKSMVAETLGFVESLNSSPVVSSSVA